MPSPNASSDGPTENVSDHEVDPLLKCPICLEEMEDRTTADRCGHAFCYECISHWLIQRNRCPLCRAIIRRILHKVTPQSGGASVDQYEDVPVPEEQQGFILSLGFMTVVRTPMDSPLYVVQPVPSSHTNRFRYALRPLEADHSYFLAGIEPGTLWVLPEDLESVTGALESHGITAIEAGTHQLLGPNARHASFLAGHGNHVQPRGIPSPRTVGVESIDMNRIKMAAPPQAEPASPGTSGHPRMPIQPDDEVD